MNIETHFIDPARYMKNLRSESSSPTKIRSLTIDDFNLLSIVGKGSYSKVALVRKKDTRVIYALKILKKEAIKTDYQMDKVLAERDILKGIEHPFIVKMHYAFQSDKKLFFALEYCPGGELFNLLQKRRMFTEDQARFYTAQIILALEALHQKGVIYRDLKPENVLLDQEGYLRVTDFGLSKKDMENGKNAFTICGTPEYLAPEVLAQCGHSKEVDWWTLGAFLYEMLTGYPPFYTEDRQELFHKIVYSKFAVPRHLSTKVVDLLSRLLQKHPSARLGYGPDDAEALKKHPWFDGMNWDSLLAKELKAPFVPKLRSDTDVSNFDPEFTSTAIESLSDLNIPDESAVDFMNWSFDRTEDQEGEDDIGEEMPKDEMDFE